MSDHVNRFDTPGHARNACLIYGFTLKAQFHGLALAWTPTPAAGVAIGLMILAFGLTLLAAATRFLWVERPLSLEPSMVRAANSPARG